MANFFDAEFDTVWGEEKTTFGGEVITRGGQTAEVVVLEFERRSGMGRTGGRSDGVGGQIVMDRDKWTAFAGGRERVGGCELRGVPVRLQYSKRESDDLSSVVLDVIVEAGN